MISIGPLGFPDPKLARLYQRALGEQWHVERDVAWDALSLQRIARPAREGMAEVYAQILLAEQFGLRLCGRLVDMGGDSWMRRAYAAQAMDEARHVDFFGTVLHRLEVEHAPSANMQALAEDMVGVQGTADLLASGQVLEVTAHVMFVDAARQGQRVLEGAIRIPGGDVAAELLSTIVRLVGRDESRHLALGARCLAAHVPHLSLRERIKLEERVSGWCEQVQGVLTALKAPLRRFGLPADALAAKIWRVQRHNFGLAGLRIGEPTRAPTGFPTQEEHDE